MKADIERLQAAGPIDPEKIPEVHIRGDVERALQVHRRRDLHDAERGLHQGRLHFAAAAQGSRVLTAQRYYGVFESWQ